MKKALLVLVALSSILVVGCGKSEDAAAQQAAPANDGSNPAGEGTKTEAQSQGAPTPTPAPGADTSNMKPGAALNGG